MITHQLCHSLLLGTAGGNLALPVCVVMKGHVLIWQWEQCDTVQLRKLPDIRNPKEMYSFPNSVISLQNLAQTLPIRSPQPTRILHLCFSGACTKPQPNVAWFFSSQMEWKNRDDRFTCHARSKVRLRRAGHMFTTLLQ